ncbi:MAG: hypothetical protein ACK4VO_12185 [Pseudobdellovibrio sp.]
MTTTTQNIVYTLYVIKLGRDFLRGLMKLRFLSIRSEVQVSRLTYSVVIDNWCNAVALMIRKLEAYNGESDQDFEIKEPILVIKNGFNSKEVSSGD